MKHITVNRIAIAVILFSGFAYTLDIKGIGDEIARIENIGESFVTEKKLFTNGDFIWKAWELTRELYPKHLQVNDRSAYDQLEKLRDPRSKDAYTRFLNAYKTQGNNKDAKSLHGLSCVNAMYVPDPMYTDKLGNGSGIALVAFYGKTYTSLGLEMQCVWLLKFSCIKVNEEFRIHELDGAFLRQ
jgi:hypothetical protein